jgi:hypothetical protein
LEAETLIAFHPFDLLPDPSAVHRRLGQMLREERLLRRLLRLSLAAREEQRRREEEPESRMKIER